MREILRNRTALVAIAVVLLLGLRLLPLPVGTGSGDRSTGPAGPASEVATARGTPGAAEPARPTPRPVVIDPRRLEGSSAPFLVLRAPAVRRGAPLVVGGQGFQPYEELVFHLQRQGERTAVEVGTATADENGFLQDVSMPLPEGLRPGSYSVLAAPPLGGPSVEAELRVEADETWGKLTSETAKPNQVVGFEGGGFRPGEKVALHLDGLATGVLAAVEASPRGEVVGTFRAPLANQGDHVVLLYGEQSKVPAVVALNIQGFDPWVVLDNYSPAPETALGFAGSDFTPGERVFVFLNNLESGPAAVVQVGDDGQFEAAGALPLGPEVTGTHTLLFVGERSQKAAEVEFTVQPYPASLQLTIYAGPPGSQVAFIGTGFARGEELRAYAGQPGTGNQVSSFRADDKGTFAGTGGFRVPRDAEAGDLTLTVVGQVSGAEATIAFTVIPLSSWAEVQPDPSGQAVVVGHGFAPGEAVDLFVGQAGEKPAATAGADVNGNARFAPMDLPTEGPGKPVVIHVKGRESGGEAQAEYYGGPTPEQSGETGGEGSLEFRPEATPSATPSP